MRLKYNHWYYIDVTVFDRTEEQGYRSNNNNNNTNIELRQTLL